MTRDIPEFFNSEGAGSDASDRTHCADTGQGWDYELEIYRRSVPYGTVAEHGLYFVAFSADRTRFDRMLAWIFGTAGDGLHDRLTDFSRPVSGAF